jgi:hypothetical protein
MAGFNAVTKRLVQPDATVIPPAVQILAALVLLLFLIKLGYGLFFSPLRNIPGSRLSAFCGWDELYTNIIMNGQWCKTYPELHRKYGELLI